MRGSLQDWKSVVRLHNLMIEFDDRQVAADAWPAVCLFLS